MTLKNVLSFVIRETRVSTESVVSGLPELSGHPLGDRLVATFCSERDGRMSFDDFLDMFSSMSASAPPSLKASFAFAALDFDGDGVIGKGDLGKLVKKKHSLALLIF